MPKKDKSKAAKALLKKEEGDKTAVSVGQMRAAEEEQRMGRRGIDEGKKKKKIPSDPIEHIRTLYGTGKANERVKKARKRLYDRYVREGKLEPIVPVYVSWLIDGEKIPEFIKKNRLSGAPAHGKYLDKELAKDVRARDEYTKTGKDEVFLSTTDRKQSIPSVGEAYDEWVDDRRAGIQKHHEGHQEQRLKGGKYWPAVEREGDDYLAELLEWRRKHGKKGKK